MTGIAAAAASGLVAGACTAMAAAGIIWRRRALDAVHEVRRPMTAVLMIAESLRGALRPGELDALSGEVASADAALAELLRLPVMHSRKTASQGLLLDQVAESTAAWNAFARTCGRRVTFENRTAPATPQLRGTIRPALSNLIANALEHASGDVHVVAAGAGEGISIKVEAAGVATGWPPLRQGEVSQGRGRGIGIARGSARAAGGRLVSDGGDGRGAEIRIPVSGRR